MFPALFSIVTLTNGSIRTKLHLHVCGIGRNPHTVHQLLHHDRVHCLVLDRVVRWRVRLAFAVVRDTLHPQYSGLLEAPVSDRPGQVRITTRHLGSLSLHLSSEELVTEEFEGS